MTHPADVAIASLNKLMRRDDKAIAKAGEFLSADLASGGLLVDEQQDRFLRTVIENSQLLSEIRVVPMTRPTRLIERIAFLDRLLKPGTEFAAPAASVKPSLAKLTLDTFEYVGLVTVSYDTLQDSIEGGRSVRGNSLEDTLLETMAEAVARDIEYYVINSDTASADPDLTNFDGVLKAASNKISVPGAVSKALFKDTLLGLPKKFRQDKSRLMYFYGPSTDTEWRDELAVRGTGLGDRAQSEGESDFRFGAYGIPTMQVTQMPEDLGVGGDEGKILLSDPRNMIVGVWRDVFFDWQKDVELRALKIVVSTRFGFQYEDPDGAAVGEDYTVA